MGEDGDADNQEEGFDNSTINHFMESTHCIKHNSKAKRLNKHDVSAQGFCTVQILLHCQWIFSTLDNVMI